MPGAWDISTPVIVCPKHVVRRGGLLFPRLRRQSVHTVEMPLLLLF